MNEQDIAAADAILLMEAEEKVKMRILQVVTDALRGYPQSSMSNNYNQAIYDCNYTIQRILVDTLKAKLI